MIQQSYNRSTDFQIVEVGEDGWAEFKKLESDQRAEYAKSEEAKRDHEAWVNAPMAQDGDWGATGPQDDWSDPVIVHAHDQVTSSNSYNWELEVCS